MRPSRPRPSVWCSASATAPCARVGREHPLRRRRPRRPSGTPGRTRPAARGGDDVVARQLGTASRVGGPCNLPAPGPVESFVICGTTGRSSTSGFRTRFSSAARKTETRRALETLCDQACASESSGIALHVLRDPDDARDAAQESLVKLDAARPPVPRRVGVLDLAAPARRQHVQGRRAGALGGRAAHRAARRGRARRLATAIPARVARRLGDAARARRAAWPSCRRRRRPSSRSRTRFDVVVRRDLRRDRAARRHREVLRPPRPRTGCGSGCPHDRGRRAHGQGGDRGDPAAPRSDAAGRRGARARPGRARRRAQDRHRGGLRGPLPRQPDHAGREDGRGARAVRRGRGALAAGEPRQARALRRDRRRSLQAGRAAGRHARLLECDVETVRGPIGKGKVRATVDGELAVRGTLTFAVGAGE